MIRVQHLLGVDEIILDLGALAPRNAEQPVEIVAHDGRLGGHRRHLAQLLELALGLLAGFLRELGLVDPLLELGEFVLAILLVAQFLLDGLHLLVQVVLALRLLHLPLDAGTDALLHLQDRDLALHQPEHALQPFRDGAERQDLLLLGDLDRQMRGDGIGELGIIVDLRHRADDLGRDLLVELHIVLELGNDRARHGLDLDLVAIGVGQRMGKGLVIGLVLGVALDLGARDAFDEHLHSAVRQLQELQDAGQRADRIDRIGRRIVVAGVHLGRQQDLLVGPHHLLERTDRLLAADKERHDHVREDDDVAQGKHGIEFVAGREADRTLLIGCHSRSFRGRPAPDGHRPAHGRFRGWLGRSPRSPVMRCVVRRVAPLGGVGTGGCQAPQPRPRAPSRRMRKRRQAMLTC